MLNHTTQTMSILFTDTFFLKAKVFPIEMALGGILLTNLIAGGLEQECFVWKIFEKLLSREGMSSTHPRVSILMQRSACPDQRNGNLVQPNKSVWIIALGLQTTKCELF